MFILQIAASNQRSAAVTESGVLYIWGRKQNHYPSRIDSSGEFTENVRPRKVFLGVDSSDRNVAFFLADSELASEVNGYSLWSYGDFKSNMLGRDSAPGNNNPIPERMKKLSNKSVLNVSCGVGHAAAIVVE